MPINRRAYQKGGCYFFTVVTHARRPLLTQSETIGRLREAFPTGTPNDAFRS